MEIIKYGNLFAEKAERKYRAKCIDCGTKVKFKETELLGVEEILKIVKDAGDMKLAELSRTGVSVWKCPFCEHINKIQSPEEKAKAFEETFKNFEMSAKKIGTVVFFPIIALVCMIIGVVGFIKELIDNRSIEDIIEAIGYILGILLAIGIVAAIIGVVVACFKFGYFGVVNY